MLAATSPSYYYEEGPVSALPVAGSAYSLWADELAFKNIYRKWKNETIFTSSLDEMMAAPTFRELVDVGPSVIPLIISELRKEPSFLVLVLQDITGENPVKRADRGDLRAMSENWIQWYQKSRNGRR